MTKTIVSGFYRQFATMLHLSIQALLTRRQERRWRRAVLRSLGRRSRE